MPNAKNRILDSDGLWGYALRALRMRAHSTGELREKLSQRAGHPADVEQTIARLKEIGYLNDKQFAESFASSRLAGEKFGKTRVIQDLKRRRVTRDVAESTVRKVYQGVDEQALIDDWIRRHYRMASREGLFRDEKDLASAYRKLLRAGFRVGEIIQALKRFAKNPDLLDGFEPPLEEPEE